MSLKPCTARLREQRFLSFSEIDKTRILGQPIGWTKKPYGSSPTKNKLKIKL